MRTYGRVYDENNVPSWVVVTTDDNGFNDAVYMTTLIQCLKLNLGESPFYANYGLPDHQSIMQQIAPDYYVSQTQQQFAQYFANLSISKLPPGKNNTPTYRVNIITQQGYRPMMVDVPT